MKKTNSAVWTTKYKNDLPDSAFMYIEPGGKKDSDGKTTPRSLRHFPYKDASGKIDPIHVRNAIARIPQAKISAQLKIRLQAKARSILANLRKSGKAFLIDLLSVAATSFDDSFLDSADPDWKARYQKALKDCGEQCKDKIDPNKPTPSEEYQMCIADCMKLKGF